MLPENKYEKYLRHFGKIIRAARKAHNEKQETLAKAMGKSRAVISLIENGKYDCLEYNTIIDLLEYLKIPFSELPPPHSIKIFLQKCYSW